MGDGGEPSFDNEDQVVISEWNKFYNLYEIILGWSLKCKRRIEKKKAIYKAAHQYKWSKLCGLDIYPLHRQYISLFNIPF